MKAQLGPPTHTPMQQSCWEEQPLISTQWCFPPPIPPLPPGSSGRGRPVTPGSREEGEGAAWSSTCIGPHCPSCPERTPCSLSGVPPGWGCSWGAAAVTSCGAGCCWSMLGSPFGGGEGGGLPSCQGERWVISSSCPFPPPGSRAHLALAGRPGWPSSAASPWQP